MTKQNDAVFAAVCSVVGADGFSDAVVLNKEQRELVIGMVTDGIMSGNVDFSAEARTKHDTEAKVKTYVGGMVSNHLRKDKRLNGGEKYQAANPGSRAGSSDDMIKNLKLLRSQLADASDIASIDTAIEARLAEIKALTVKAVAIDVSALPEEFRHLVK